MSAVFIAIGFTAFNYPNTDSEVHGRVEEFRSFILGIPDQELVELVVRLDVNETFTCDDPDPSTLRGRLVSAARTLFMLPEDCTTWWQVGGPESPARFIVSGGPSWGDAPFDGYHLTEGLLEIVYNAPQWGVILGVENGIAGPIPMTPVQKAYLGIEET